MEPISDDLFDLIQALSRPEKRYFSIESQKPGREPSNQFILFNILNGLDKYDEEKITTQLFRKIEDEAQAEKFVKRLAVEKNLLYNALLKSVRHFNSEGSNYIKLKDTLIDAKHLLEKGLFSQSAKLLRKAKRLAMELDDQLALLEINRAERSLVWVLTPQNQENDIQELISEKDRALELLENEFACQDDYDKVCLEMARHNKLSKTEIAKRKTDFLQLITNEKEKTAFAQLRHIQTSGLLNILIQEPDLAFKAIEEEYNWWAQHPHLKKNDLYRYKISLHNYLMANYRRKKFEVVLDTIENLEKKNNRSSFEDLMTFEFTSIFKLLILMNTSQLKQAKALVPKVVKGLRSFFLPPFKKMPIYYNLGILFFIFENFQECQKWLYHLVQGHNTGNREDIRIFGNLLNLVCYLELEDPDKSANLYRSIRRTLNEIGKNKEQDLEFSILEHLNKIANAPLFDQPNALSSLKDDLKKTRDEAGIKRSVPFLDEFYIWAESRHSKIPMVDVLIAENKKHT